MAMRLVIKPLLAGYYDPDDAHSMALSEPEDCMYTLVPTTTITTPTTATAELSVDCLVPSRLLI